MSSSKAAGKRSKFAELRALRQSGKKTFDSYEVEQVDSLYEEVDEAGYKQIVRDRLNQDDFVVDDNGEGYADDGREEWDRVPVYESDSADDLPLRGKRGAGSGPSVKHARDDELAKREANDRDISQYFSKGAGKPPSKPKPIKTEDDDKFLADLLGEVDSNVRLPVSRPSRKEDRSGERRKARAISPGPDTRQPLSKKAKVVDSRAPPAAGTGDMDSFMDDDGFISVNMEPDSHSPTGHVSMSDPAPSSPTIKAVERKAQPYKATAQLRSGGLGDDGQNDEDKAEEEVDDDMMEVAHAAAITTSNVNLSASRPAKKPVKPDPYPSPASSSPPKAPGPEAAVDASSWNQITQGLNVMSSTPSEARSMGKMDYKDAIEEDGSLNMFWIDYTEVNGCLCLFGKVLNKKSKAYVSCFLKVDNILRKLYFLPRQFHKGSGQNGPEGDEEQEREEVGMMDLYSEVDAIMSRMKVDMYKAKVCTRKYAFELRDVPREAQYLKLLYPYSKPQLDVAGAGEGETYSHVFGANTALFEQFVLWKNIMGPCWLRIRDADFGAVKNASHCKLEVLAEHPDMVSVLGEGEGPSEAPPLTLMSVALRTAFNARDNRQEILAISARVYEGVSLSETAPADRLPCRTFTLVRPHNGTAFPVGFEALAARDKRRVRGLVKAMRQESELLSFFLAQLDLADPDVILGHQLEGVDYSVLLSRLHDKKVHQWSRLGRLRRSAWPGTMGKTGGNVFAERQVMAGRLLCDLANDAGKSVMFRCQSWGLTEMCSLYLPAGEDQQQNRRRDVDNEAALKTWAGTKDGLVDYLTHMEADTYFIAALALRVQILPLTKVLTNLAGNSWARTLTGTRAERNEYILLHEFHRNKYICPDKQAFSGAAGGGRGRPQSHQQKQQSGQAANAVAVDDEENGHGGLFGGAGGGSAGSSKKKDKYKGGLVFEPEKGLYDKFVLVMDFNSLYPSIIQEFNICFTTVDRSGLGAGDNDDNDEQDVVPEVPPADLEQGILPRLIATLVSRRRQVKSLMKDRTSTAEQLATWDIKQLALKLTANSMYGCLGYTKSRFYARPLAVLTTYKGREILRSTKELAESSSLQVIYGDTDSVMINANVDSVAAALRVGHEFRRAVNERYRLLEIDIDNVFRRILLQAKKKYAAVNMVEVDGRFVEKLEVKGLDMRRREYCALSKEVSSRVLNEILSGDETDEAVARIHAYLRETAEAMRAGRVAPQKYVVFTQLGKAPREYPNADSMPQVQVALRELARGRTVRRGDVLSYIISAGEAAPPSDPVAKRAYTPADVLRPDSGLSPDVEWYMAKQIFPPVERLCANIAGTSTAQLAENLGLDPRRFAGQAAGGAGRPGAGPADLALHPLESQIPDEVRFADCVRLELRCRVCKALAAFEGLGDSGASSGSSGPPGMETRAADSSGQPKLRVTAAGIACGSCSATLPPISVVAQVERAVRSATARYYEGWLVCDDPSCGNRTRQTSVYGSRCLGPRGLLLDCSGRMRYESGERDMYNQLVYLASLFDVDRARVAAHQGHHQREDLLALAEHNRVRFGTVKAVVDRYLDKCGRQWVAMDTLFTKLGFAVVPS